MTKLKLIPKHQRGASMVVPSGLDMNTLLANSWKKLRDQAMLEQQTYIPAGDATIQQAVNFINRNQAPAAAPVAPATQVAQAPAKRNVQIPANALAGIQFKAPNLGELKGIEAAPIQAKPGGNQQTELQNYFGKRATNSEINRVLHGSR